MSNLTRTALGFVLKEGVNTLLIELPALDPSAVESWEGFQIAPKEDGIKVSFFSPLVALEYWYDGLTWSQTTEGATSTPAQIRQGLPTWVGPVQLRLHLTRLSNGRSPIVSSVAIGYNAAGTPLGYCLQYGLPALLGQPVELHRLERPTADGAELVIPGSLDYERIVKVNAWRVRRQNQEGQLLQKPDGNYVISLPRPIPGTDVMHVRYLYRPKVEYHPSTYQITDIPCCRLIVQNARNRRRMVLADSVRLSESLGRRWETLYLCHRAVDASVLASSFEEAWSIASQMLGAITAQGYIDVPTLGLQVGVSVSQGAESATDPEKLERALLYTVNFQLLLRDLPEGEYTTDVDLYTINGVVTGEPIARSYGLSRDQ